MPSSWTRPLGVSMIVCLVVTLAVPALAAGPFHGRTVSCFEGREWMRGTPGGFPVLNSLQLMGIPVVGPISGLLTAGRVIQRFIFPTPSGNPVPFTGNYSHGTRPGAMNRPADYRFSAPGMTTLTRQVGLAENLTAYLGGKGYNVSDLEGTITDAHDAIASSNLTALGNAVKSFRREINAKIESGTINRTVIGDFLKTFPANHARSGVHGGVPVMPGGFHRRKSP